VLKCEILFAVRVGNWSVESKSIFEGPISIVELFEISMKVEVLSGGWEYAHRVGGIRFWSARNGVVPYRALDVSLGNAL
jgi:hypothetical protein